MDIRQAARRLGVGVSTLERGRGEGREAGFASTHLCFIYPVQNDWVNRRAQRVRFNPVLDAGARRKEFGEPFVDQRGEPPDELNGVENVEMALLDRVAGGSSIGNATSREAVNEELVNAAMVVHDLVPFLQKRVDSMPVRKVQ